jgi:hypothetical protein
MNTLKYQSILPFAPVKHAKLAILFIVFLVLTDLVFADAGHNHGAEAPAAKVGAVTPRFSANSDLFEVVGMLNGDELSIFIDQYASNEPVLKAKVEVESGNLKAVAEFQAARGDYSMPGAMFKKSGTYAIVLTITAGNQTDILAGDLVVPDPESDHTHEATARPWLRWLGYAAAALALMGFTFTVVRRARRPASL